MKHMKICCQELDWSDDYFTIVTWQRPNYIRFGDCEIKFCPFCGTKLEIIK